MRKFPLALVGLVLVATSTYAGDSTLSYTAGQSTAIQTRLIPRYNAARCRAVGQADDCSTAQLQAAGCRVVVVKTITLTSCVVFTSDAAGEAAFLKEMANQGGIAVFNQLIAEEVAAFQTAACARFKAMTGPQQQTYCTDHSQPATCQGPCP